MQSEVHEIDPVTVRIEVEVPWDRVQKGLDASYGRIQKTARIRGFRPGKAPRNVIKQIYGPQVKDEVVQSVVEQSLMEVLQERELPVVAMPRVDVSTFQDGSPLSFEAIVEVRPTLENIDTELEVTRPSSVITDEAVEAEIERLRERNAVIMTPDPMRPAKKGDLLTIDFTVEVDGEERPEMAAKEMVVELGKNGLPPEFDEALEGKQAGDEVEVRVAFGEDVVEELQNKRALFKVSVRDLREKILPDLDDELAKDAGEHETLEELRAATRAELEKAAAERAESTLREQLLDKLVEKNPVPLPPSMVNEAERTMAQELAYFMQMTGSGAEELGAGLSQALHSQAERRVRISILISELARQNEMTVEPEEIEARMAKIAEQTGKHIAKVRVEMQGERRENLKNQILQDKLLDYLLSRATVTDAPAGEASAAEESEAG